MPASPESSLPPAIAAFCARFDATRSAAAPASFYEVFSFGDSVALADSLAALVMAGVKRATASSLWSYHVEGKPLPAPGDLSIVTNAAGEPLCVIETTRIDIVAFDDVSAEFAAVEGEGDGSLAYWREGHLAYFTRECTRSGRLFEARMPVVCERFRVVFRDGDGG